MFAAAVFAGSLSQFDEDNSILVASGESSDTVAGHCLGTHWSIVIVVEPNEVLMIGET